MSAVHEYKHTSWSENCSLCVQLKARADTAIAALEADLAIESKDADGAVDSVVAKVKWYHKELATAEAALVQQKRLTGASDNAIATLEHVADDLRTTLAERDRMLDDIGAGIVRLAQEAALTGHEERYDGLRAAARVVADLRARAEEHYAEAKPDETFVLPSFRTRAEEPPRFHRDENGELVRDARAEEGSGT